MNKKDIDRNKEYDQKMKLLIIVEKLILHEKEQLIIRRNIMRITLITLIVFLLIMLFGVWML